MSLGSSGWLGLAGNEAHPSATPSPHRRAPCQASEKSSGLLLNSTPLSHLFQLFFHGLQLICLVWCGPSEMSQVLGAPPLGHLLCPGSLSRFH